MLRAFQKFIILSAGVVILLHTLIPHSHYYNVSAIENQEISSSNRSIFDWLSYFYTDLGEGHLEHFMQGELSIDNNIETADIDFFQDFVFLKLVSDKSEVIEFLSKIQPEESSLIKYLRGPTSSLRGPPFS